MSAQEICQFIFSRVFFNTTDNIIDVVVTEGILKVDTSSEKIATLDTGRAVKRAEKMPAAAEDSHGGFELVS